MLLHNKTKLTLIKTEIFSSLDIQNSSILLFRNNKMLLLTNERR